MNPIVKCAVSTVVLVGTASLSALALAGSLSASSAAGGSSASSASSTSVEKSSDSSTGNKGVAEGPHKIIDVATVPERPGMVRMKLQAVATAGADGEFFLYVPQQTVAQNRLAAGQTVLASQRPYGLEFAHADTRQAFFLVLNDDWFRDLASNPVVL